MSALDQASGALRLRGGSLRTARRRPVDAEVSKPPRFSTLLLLGVTAILTQATVLHGFTLRGAHLSLVTVLVVWTGLRCGVVTGGWLGLLCGLLQDALGGGGANVVIMTLAGFLSGTLANRFFSDSLPVFIGAIAFASAVRFVAAYFIFEFVYGERGLLVPMSHEFVWAALLNCAAGTVVLLGLRARSQWRLRLR
jgi:rod shape-determining protein MreD